MYSYGVEDENYLRGVQLADEDGVVRFTSIFPACSPGRWPHVHFEVYPDADAIADSAQAIATSQAAMAKSACDAVYATSEYAGSVQPFSQLTLENDNVLGEDGQVLQWATVTGDVERGYALRLPVRVDTRTVPTGGRPPGGGPGGTPSGHALGGDA